MKIRYVSLDHWRDALKFLMGLGTNPSLNAADQRQLGKYAREGMTSNEATQTLIRIGWRMLPPLIGTERPEDGGAAPPL